MDKLLLEFAWKTNVFKVKINFVVLNVQHMNMKIMKLSPLKIISLNF